MMRIKSLLLPASVLFLAAGFAYAQSNKSSSPPKADAQMQKVLDALKSLGVKPIEKLSPAEARQQPTPADAVKKVMKEQGMSTAPDPGVTVKDMSIPGPHGDIPIHVFTPEGKGPFPVMLYYHGGGFVIADTKTYEASPRALAKGANAIMVAVDYHQAPEHKFPAAADDAYAAYTWVLQHAAEINGDPKRVAVGGESAGGNLAAVVSQMARDKHGTMPVHQLLVYPMAGHDFNTPSYQRNADAKPLNKPMMEWFYKHYLSKPEDASNPYAVPLAAKSLKGLPPATIIAAEIDPLLSEGKTYADRLKNDGVKVTYKEYPGVTHEFFGMGKVVDKAKEAEDLAARELRQAFGSK
jgi:acetyl esterase